MRRQNGEIGLAERPWFCIASLLQVSRGVFVVTNESRPWRFTVEVADLLN